MEYEELAGDAEAAGQEAQAPAREQVDWQAEARKWEKRSKENRRALSEAESARDEAAARLAEMTSSLERATAELAAIAAERDAAAWREAASRETGVPAELLRGSTADEVMEHARALAPHLRTPRAPYVGSEGGASRAATAAGSAREAFAEALRGML